MKKLFLILAFSLLVIVLSAQTVKIRWYDINHPGTKSTVTLNEDGTPTGLTRLSVYDGGEYLINQPLADMLVKDMFPDIPFCLYVPVYNPPPKYLAIPTGPPVIGFEYVYNPEWALFWDMYNAQKEKLFSEVREYLVILEEYKEATLPHGDNIRWESVDMTKPYRYRYKNIPVDNEKYTGKSYWMPCFDDLYDRYSTMILNHPEDCVDYIVNFKMQK